MIRPSDHFDGRRFFNPGCPSTDRSLAEVLRWKLGGRTATWPSAVAVEQVVPPACFDGIRLTSIGHATVLVQCAGLNILVDPVWSTRVGPFGIGPRRVSPPAVAIDALPKLDAILVTHNHYDHLDVGTLRRLDQSPRPLIVTPLGNDRTIHRALPNARIVTLDWFDGIAIGSRARVDVVPACHWSGRGLCDRRRALWGGFMIRTDAGLVWLCGDTGYGTGDMFRAIRAAYGPPDVALIPIGAYAPEWFMHAQHVDPFGAVQIFEDVAPKHAIGIHWGVFRLSDEPRDQPRDQLARACRYRRIASGSFVAAEPGHIWCKRPALD